MEEFHNKENDDNCREKITSNSSRTKVLTVNYTYFSKSFAYHILPASKQSRLKFNMTFHISKFHFHNLSMHEHDSEKKSSCNLQPH